MENLNRSFAILLCSWLWFTEVLFVCLFVCFCFFFYYLWIFNIPYRILDSNLNWLSYSYCVTCQHWDFVISFIENFENLSHSWPLQTSFTSALIILFLHLSLDHKRPPALVCGEEVQMIFHNRVSKGDTV